MGLKIMNGKTDNRIVRLLFNGNPYSGLMLCGIFLIYTMAAVCVTNVTVSEGIKYIVFQCFFVYILGALISNALSICMRTEFQNMAIYYAIGYAMQVINWYISIIVGSKNVQIELFIIEVVVLAVIFWCKKDSSIGETCHIDTSVFIFFLLVIAAFLGIRFFMILGYNMIPYGNIANNNRIHDDFLWEIFQTVMTKHSLGIPVDDWRWLGDKEYYHYYGYVCNGVMSNVTGISCVKILSSLSFINEGIFFVISAIAFLQYITKKERLICYGLILMVFTSGIEMYSVVTWSGHITTIPLSVDISISYMMLSIGILLYVVKNKLINWSYCILFFVFFAMSTGAKGPCALTALIPILILCTGEFNNNKTISIRYAICAVASFGGIYAFVDSGMFDKTNMYGSNTRMISRFLEPMEKYPISDIYQITANYPNILSKILLLIRYFFFSNPAIFITLLILLIVWFSKDKKLSLFHYALLSGYLSGYFFATIVNQDGCSEMYFTFAAFPFGVGIVIALLSELEISKTLYFQVTTIIVFLWIGIMCFYGSSKTVFMSGYHNIVHNDHDECSIRENRTYRKSIYEACEWLQNNSLYSDIIASNAVIDDVISGYEVAIFTERRQWLEYSKYTGLHNDELEEKKNKLIDYYENGTENILKEIYNDGVRYIVNVKGTKYERDLYGDKKLRVVFENEEVQIAYIEEK